MRVPNTYKDALLATLDMFPDLPSSVEPAKGEEDPRQQGRTPHAIASFWCEWCDLQIDLAADEFNAVLPCFMTREGNALAWDWAPLRCWLNPPFANLMPWVGKCIEEAGKGAKIVMIAPAATDTAWFLRATNHSFWYLFDGRVRFDPPPGITYTQPMFGCALFVFERANLANGKFCGWLDHKTGVPVSF